MIEKNYVFIMLAFIPNFDEIQFHEEKVNF